MKADEQDRELSRSEAGFHNCFLEIGDPQSWFLMATEWLNTLSENDLDCFLDNVKDHPILSAFSEAFKSRNK